MQMDSELLSLIEQMSSLLDTGGRLPLSSRIMVQANEISYILDQMRQALPREIARARHICQERDHILSEATLEAESIRAAAQAERTALIAEHTVTVEALRAAEILKHETRLECERMKLDADAYALHSLRELQIQLVRLRTELDQTLKTVIGGIELLENRTAYGIAEAANTRG
jgi:hypothetical protein